MNALLLLGIDTSGKTASVAVCTENSVLAQTTVYTKLTHSQVILPICKDVLKSAGLTLSDVDVIAAAAGPGSYTGLRIGIAAVKAMCFALDKPCIGISTLESLAYNVSLHKGIICAVIAARLDLVYCAVFRSDGRNVTRLSEDEILPIDELMKRLEAFNEDVVTVGDAAEKLAGERFMTAPPHLKLQLASSLCAAGFTKEPFSPDKLEAAYMEITKAEKDLRK
ncbi:MAG: tRNA (adenosine(37)-N6)-threonylcarbamoyltransferase complex dimerization subunit type 1 TsaB [Oscillospiraceae bacterium]|nr:tRNA (adenosine(37)-N6)-threonylcarbamoyltransferase complex dimerization subunit type 1 TsaB [Oscillospiraceae bacterium]